MNTHGMLLLAMPVEKMNGPPTKNVICERKEGKNEKRIETQHNTINDQT